MFLILLTLLLLFVYFYLNNHFKYWSKKGVPNPPVNYIFGNLWDAILLKKSLGQIYMQIYENYPELSYVGFFKNRQPAILLRDPQLIEDVLVKNFSNFHDNDIDVNEKNDPLFAKNPFAVKGNRWKIVRSQLMSCFTNTKVKSVYPLIQANTTKLVNYLENLDEETINQEGLEAKELFSKFTIENVASCAFGLEGNAFEDPNSGFLKIGKQLFTPTFSMAVKHLILFIEPALGRFIDTKFFPDGLAEYFREIIRNTLKYRSDNNVVRNDFLDIMKTLKDKDNNFTDEDITAHAAGFFGDGFETSSIVMSHALFEIAYNIDVQNKLYKEIEEVYAKNKGIITYEIVNEMKYLDCIFNENLRKNSALLFLGKVATNNVTLPHPKDVNKMAITIEKGTSIAIPIYAIQHDEKYFSNPEKFDPDRFSDENKDNIRKYTFMPFGEGPRICLGQRFGVLQVKMGIISIVKNFEIRVNDRTITPLKINPKYFMLAPIGGIWLNFYKRKN